MTGLLTEIADYDEDGSWGRMSGGWPEIRCNKVRDMYVFANCVRSIPYGSYVLVDDACLRVHAKYIEQLKSDFKGAGEPDANESVERREQTGKLRLDGLRERAPQWWKE